MKHFQHPHREFSWNIGESRWIWGKVEGGARAEVQAGGESKKEKRKLKKKTREIKKQAREERKKLLEELEKRKKGKEKAKPKGKTVFDRNFTREERQGGSPERQKYSPKNDEAIDALLETERAMTPPEVQRMQKAQEALYRQYIDPAFALFIHNHPNEDAVHTDMRLLMKHPGDFVYHESQGKIEITKRPTGDAEIPDNFRVVMENTGRIDGADSKDMQITHAADWKMTLDNGEIPWMDSAKYKDRIYDYMDRWSNAYWGSGADSYEAAFDAVPKEMLDVFEINHIVMPRLMMEMVAARNFGVENGRADYQDFADAMTGQAVNLEEAKQAPGEKLLVMLDKTDERPELYGFSVQGDLGTFLVISDEGYLMEPDGNGYYRLASPDYTNRVARDYYAAHPEAEALMSDQDRQWLEHGGASPQPRPSGGPSGPQAPEQLDKSARIQAIQQSLPGQDYQWIKEIGSYLSPAHYEVIQRQEEGNRAQLEGVIIQALGEKQGTMELEAVERLMARQGIDSASAKEQRIQAIQQSLPGQDYQWIKEIGSYLSPAHYEVIQRQEEGNRAQLEGVIIQALGEKQGTMELEAVESLLAGR